MNDKLLNHSCRKRNAGRGSTSHVLPTAPKLLLLHGPPKGVPTDGGAEPPDAAGPALSQVPDGAQAILKTRMAIKGLGFI